MFQMILQIFVFILNYWLTSIKLFSMKEFIVTKVQHKPSPQTNIMIIKTIVEIWLITIQAILLGKVIN